MRTRALALTAATVLAAAASPPAPVHAGARPSAQLVRGLGGVRGSARRAPGFHRRAGRRFFLRRVLHGLGIGYLLHLLFGTPGGLLLLLAITVLLTLAFRRRQRRA